MSHKREKTKQKPNNELSNDCKSVLNNLKINTSPDGVKLDPLEGEKW